MLKLEKLCSSSWFCDQHCSSLEYIAFINWWNGLEQAWEKCMVRIYLRFVPGASMTSSTCMISSWSMYLFNFPGVRVVWDIGIMWTLDSLPQILHSGEFLHWNEKKKSICVLNVLNQICLRNKKNPEPSWCRTYFKQCHKTVEMSGMCEWWGDIEFIIKLLKQKTSNILYWLKGSAFKAERSPDCIPVCAVYMYHVLYRGILV